MTKRLALVLSLLSLALPAAVAQNSTWKSDPAHSEVDFSVRHGGVSNVHGRFGAVAATLIYNEADITKSRVTATIDTASVWTGEAARDNHLKTDAFFDVAKLPTATFTSTAVSRQGGKLIVTGNLTLHGITHPVTLEVEGPATPVENGTDHKLRSGFEATTTLSRTAFGIGNSFPSVLIGDEIKLTIELEIVKQ